MTTTTTDEDRDAQITRSRHTLLAELAGAVESLRRAADSLAELRSPQLYDIDLIDGRDGRDIATFLDDGLRYIRAAYAVVHIIADQDTS